MKTIRFDYIFFSSKMEQYNEMIKFWNLELKNEKKKTHWKE